MKQWIKLETNMMYNEGIRRLYAEHRHYGMAAYIMLRLHIEAVSDNGIPVNEAIAFGKAYSTKSIIISVIYDYGLFDISEKGLITAAALTNAHVDTQVDADVDSHVDTQVDPQVDPDVDTQVDPPVPSILQKRKEMSHSLSQAEQAWHKGFTAHYPNISKMKEPLTQPQYQRLLKHYSKSQICSKLSSLDNMPHADKKYISCYRVLLNWLKRDEN